MQILIVDDDIVTVDAIVNSVDWEKLNIESVYTAYSIETAKEILLEHTIEIVLSDIEMPCGNGLDLLQWFREQGQEGEFLLLTCHEKFDYAVNAVKMKATEYLLKPFDAAEVETALRKCITNVRIRQNYKKDKEWLHHNLENVRRAFLEQLLKEEFSEKLFEGHTRNADQKFCLEKGKTYRMLVSRNTDIKSAKGEYGSLVLRFILMNIQAESLLGEPRIERTVCFEENGELVTVLFCENQEEKELEEAGRMLQKNCEVYLKALVTLCISPACSVEQFHDMYLQMAECVFSNISVYGKVFFLSSVKEQEKTEIFLKDKETLKELLETRQKSGFLNQLKREVSKANIEGELSSQALANFRQEILQMVYSYLTERGISVSQLLGNNVSAELERKAMRSALDMIRWVSYLLEQTYEYEEEVKNSQSIIGKIQEYIHQHYMERIGRNEIAEEFFLAPEYLAKMYKRKTGVSLKDYINEYRIRQAKRLLGEGYMVSEAAMEVGFDNFSYFSTLFRKYTGVSPNAYKKK